MTVLWKDAKPKIDELLQAAANGEQIVIQLEDGKTVEFMARTKSDVKRRNAFGSARGWFEVNDSFFEPLEDFAEYSR